MKADKPLERVFKLLFYLNTPFGRCKDECLAVLGVSESTFYDYRDKLRGLGFCIVSEGGVYRLDAEASENKWFTSLFHIGEEDAYLIAKAIDRLEVSTPRAQALKNKLLQVFDSSLMAEQLAKQNEDSVRCQLLQAIKERKQVLLCDYHSGKSQTVSDRLVEPFQLDDSFNLLWCYDIEKQANRQFKVSRIGRVEVAAIPREYQKKHQSQPTDIFRNTGVLDKGLSLKLNIRAYNLLIEEYPLAEREVQKQDDGTFLLLCKVAKYEGPARFVLGLWEDVELAGDEGFKDFLAEKMQHFSTFRKTRNLKI